MKRINFPMVGALIVSLTLTGCVFAVDSKKCPPSAAQAAQPTKGQQLVDLKKAHDSGAITDAEFQAEKDKLLQGK